MRSKLTFIGSIVALGLLSGCASKPQYYPNTLEKNVKVNLKLADRGGLLTSVSASAGVNNFAANCETDYQGFVELADGPNPIGLAIGKPTFLIVEIARRRRGNSIDFQRGTMLVPAPGKKYEIDVSYADGMFDFRLYEAVKTGRKELPLSPRAVCGAGK